MKKKCNECKKEVRIRKSDGRLVYHRAIGRKWCKASPNYQPANYTRKAQHQAKENLELSRRNIVLASEI